MKYLLIISTLFLSQTSFASCGNYENVLTYANGMFNERVEAQSNLDTYRALYVKQYAKSPIHLSYLAYNTNESLLVQIYEVYTQYISSTGEGFWKNMNKIYPFANDSLKESVSDQAARDANLDEQIRAYQKFVDYRYNTVTIAHSQGNFYTLSALRYLDSPRTKMISVATPAQAVYDDGPYFTFTTDPIGALVPLALEPNLVKASPSEFDHGFMTHYMKDANAKSQILAATNIAFSTHQDNQFVKSLDEHDGYFNSDMKNVLRWTQKQMTTGISSAGQELLQESVFEMADNTNLTCEARSYSELVNLLNQKSLTHSAQDLAEAMAILKTLIFK